MAWEDKSQYISVITSVDLQELVEYYGSAARFYAGPSLDCFHVRKPKRRFGKAEKVGLAEILHASTLDTGRNARS